MKVATTNIKGVLLIQPKIYYDERGYFFESWQDKHYQELGINPFVQDNCSASKKNVLRGMHYQIEHPQGQLVWVSYGKIFDAVVDLREHSPTFGQYFCTTLSGEVDSEHRFLQLYMPEGCAHGFCVMSEDVIMHYKCTNFYYAKDEGGIKWDSFDIPWPVKHPIMSKKDLNLPSFETIKYGARLPKT